MENVYHIGEKPDGAKHNKIKRYIKIGKSYDSVARKKGLQTGNPRELEIIYTFKTHMANEVEKALHKKYKKHRRLGEWFLFENNEYDKCIKLSNHITAIINHIFTYNNVHNSQFLKKIANDFINKFVLDDYSNNYTYKTIDNICKVIKNDDNDVDSNIDSDVDSNVDSNINSDATANVCNFGVDKNNKKRYGCKPCNYRTNKQANYNRHLESTRHYNKANNIEKEYPCSRCDTKFTSSNSRWHHEKHSCHNNLLSVQTGKVVEQLIRKIDEKDKQMEERDKFYMDKIRSLVDATARLAEVNNKERHKYLDIITNDTHTVNKHVADKSISIMSYIMKHYRKAPVVRKITDKKAIKMLEYHGKSKNDKLTTEEKMIKEFKLNKLHKYLGNIIIDTYKDAKNPENQSVWTSDSSRLSFVIMSKMSTGKKEWVVDKNGIKVTNLIINPLLSKTSKTLSTYIEKCGELSRGEALNPDYDSDDSNYSKSDKYNKSRMYDEDLVKEMSTAKKIMDVIEQGELHTQILKFICPFFKLDAVRK